MYAVIQLGAAIFGIGETDQEALADAAQWLDDGFEIVDSCNAKEGELICEPCTERLADAVEQVGCDIKFCVNDNGVYDLDDPE